MFCTAYTLSNDLGPRLSVLFLLVVCGLVSCSDQNNEAEELQRVTVGITDMFMGEAAIFTAHEHGFFEDHGLEVTLKRNLSGAASLRDLFREEVDIAHVAETPVAYALLDTTYVERQPVPPFRIFADMIYTDQAQKVIARKDHGIENPDDLAGKTIAIYHDTQLDYYFDSFLLEHQISKDDLTLVNMEPASHAQAIERGEVDVAVTWEPYATHIEQALGDNATTLTTRLSYATLWLATTLDSFAEANPEVLVSYLQSLKKAQQYINDYPEQARQLIARNTGTRLEIVESLWPGIDFELSLSERMLILLEDQGRWIQQNNSVATTDYNVQELINFEPMRRVYPEGITVIYDH